MKQMKRPAGKRPTRSAAHAKVKQSIRAKRPLHRKVLLHPFSLMILLCAGVLIVGSTFRSYAASYNVTATVPAPAVTSPAVIRQPFDQQHFSVPAITVTGSCPPQSYVKLSRNVEFSGAAQCVNGAFQIQTSLAGGLNSLQAQDYSLTDQAGPAGTPLNVYYDPTLATAPAAPAAAPTTVWVANLDSAGYQNGAVQRTSDNPTINGWAPPFSKVVVTFHSDPQTCLTTADNLGWWTCTLDHALPAGLHHVAIVATTPAGKTLTFPTFQINVVPALQDLLIKNVQAFFIRTDYNYQAVQPGQQAAFEVGLTGGTAPYHLVVAWGDGAHTTYTRNDQTAFTVTHMYSAKAKSGGSAVLITASDAQGNTALMQLSLVIKAPAAAGGLNTSFFATIHRWLWLVWPAYIVVLLMAIGYYLGERDEYQRLTKAKKFAHAGGRR